MPLYEYDCPACGRFEALQRLGDSPLKTHSCGSRVKKVMSAGSFAFKGSGVHANDHARRAAPACDRPRGEGCASCPSNAEA